MPTGRDTEPTDLPAHEGAGPFGDVALTGRQLLAAGGLGAGAIVFGGAVAGCGGSGQAKPDFTLRAVRSDVTLGGRRAAT